MLDLVRRRVGEGIIGYFHVLPSERNEVDVVIITPLPHFTSIRHANLHHKTSGLFQLFCLLYLLDSSNNIFVLSMYLIVASIRTFLIF
jgi:hypothetical protein